jgi:hypothetical protein
LKLKSEKYSPIKERDIIENTGEKGGYRGVDKVVHVSYIPEIMEILKNQTCPEKGVQRNSSGWK